ncbi:MAG: uroporphyrinogen decarboxylase family protein [Promethearchaeia archaeon]
MKARERILKTLDHEEPDKVPSFEVSIDNLSICNHFGEKYVFEGIVDTYAKTYDLCGSDIKRLTETILVATGVKSAIKNIVNRELNLYKKIGIDLAAIPVVGWIPHPRECGKDYLIDDYGRIFDLKKHEDGMDLAYYRDGAFKTFEDYESAEPINPDDPRREIYFKMIKVLEKKSDGKIFAIPAIFGLMETTWQAFGFVNFSKLLRKRHQIKKIFDDRGKLALEFIKRINDWGDAGAVFIFDDWGYKSGLLMNASNFREYILPWYKKICDAAHKAGIKVILHSCGDVCELVPDIISAGIDGLHPIEPTTANPEFDIFKLNEKYGDKLSFIGNVSPQDLTDKNEGFIRAYTKKLLEEVAPNGGYILSSGHSIPPSVKLENFLAMHETLKKYGKYGN